MVIHSGFPICAFDIDESEVEDKGSLEIPFSYYRHALVASLVHLRRNLVWGFSGTGSRLL